ncbi:site-specific integrase [Micromonospora matsumotoense]|uniref:site-specific integrase n=1 Tax=Micromonospora matsumotoense TaxID=121616 RepID=UPI003D8EEEB4
MSTLSGRRERVRRGGYLTRGDAERARDALLARSTEECTSDTWTVSRWLRYWLSTNLGIRPSTLRSYTDHVEHQLIPHLGRHRLTDLTNLHVTATFADIAVTPNRHGRPPTPSTLHRIRATLRSALNAAIRHGLLRDNPARFVRLATPRRPQARVWTDHRVQAWRQHGERYAVAVWTTQQLAHFLGHTADDRLTAMWWLISLRGLRRGETAGLRWVDVDLDGRVITIDQQRIAYGQTVTVGPPKTAASRRTVALDHTTVTILRQHRRRQLTEQTEHAGDWTDSGYVFTQPDGQPLHPDYLTRRFRRLVTDSGLPPVRLHDLRHGAASLAHSAGADLKAVQEQLGHTSIVLTADTYTSVLLDLHFTVAEATARLVLAAAARVPGRKHRTPTRHPRTAATPTARRPKPLPGTRIRREPHPGAGRAHVTPKRHPKIKTV